jgi:hypothetical protein
MIMARSRPSFSSLSSFTRDFLVLFAAPALWLVHFLLAYGLTGLICARPSTENRALNESVLAWVLGAAAIIAIGMIAAIHWRTVRQARSPRFVLHISAMLGLLASLAIVWETLPVFMLPACG